MKYFKKLIGKKCYLSPLNIEDADQFCEWLSDPILATQFGSFDMMATPQFMEKWYNEIDHEKEKWFSIVSLEDGMLLGCCSLIDIDHRNQTAKLLIYIGNKEKRNQGFGSDAINLLLDFGFNILNLNNIRLTVFAYNKNAINFYEKLGFRNAGKIRQARIIAGKKYDLILMDLLADEFESPFILKFMKE